MKILTIEWGEDGVECKYVAPADERTEEVIRAVPNWDSVFASFVARNQPCINYFSVNLSACTLVKIGDDVLLDTRKKAEPTPKSTAILMDRRNLQKESAERRRREKPLIGVKPRYLHDEERMAKLEEGIERFLAAGATPKKEWLEELEELKRRCGEDRPDIAYHWNTVIDTER